MDRQEEQQQHDDKKSLVPAGTGIALICFFLPWIKYSCGGIKTTMSGNDIGGIIWLVFIAALVIFISFFYSKNSGKLKALKPIAFWGSIGALVIILIKYIDFKNGIHTELGDLRPEDIGFTIEYGGYGTLLGFVLSLIGSSYLDK